MLPTPAASDDTANLVLEFMDRYRDDWVGLATNVLGMELDVWQAEVIDAANKGERRLSIASGHGVGKTACEAAISVAALTTLPYVKVIVTAPSGPQLWDALYSEIKMWMGKLPQVLQDLFVIGAERIEAKAAPESIFLSCRTSRAETPEAMQGIHAEGGRVILIADEASGIPEAVYEAGAGSMSGTGATTILAGNPTRASGFFHATHHQLAFMWKRWTVSCLTSRRADPDFIADMKARYGEESNRFRVRVLGLFPLSDDDSYISMDLVEAAMTRDIQQDLAAPVFWGLDVARFGSDTSVLVKRQSKVVSEKVKRWQKMDLMQLTGAIKHEWDVTPVPLRPREILVDVIGLGAGVVDRLRELELPVRGVNVAESPAFDPTNKFYRLRDELWGKGRAWLEGKDVRLTQDEDWHELSQPRYKFMSNGSVKIEAKIDMKKRGVNSPDCADAFLLTFASDAAVGSGSQSLAWNKPLRRNVKGVSF